jgi:hypothetical protein
MVELDLQIYYKKKCLKQAQNALAVHMVISSKVVKTLEVLLLSLTRTKIAR